MISRMKFKWGRVVTPCFESLPIWAWVMICRGFGHSVCVLESKGISVIWQLGLLWKVDVRSGYLMESMS